MPFPVQQHSIFPAGFLRTVVPLAFLLIIVPCITLHAQQDSFVPERPGQTWSTDVAAPGYVHFEAGLLMQRAAFTSDGGDGSLSSGEVYRHTIWQLPAMMLRVGVSEKVEFRIATKYQRMSWRLEPDYFDSDAVDDPVVEDRQSGLTVVNMGIKTLINHENGWIPQTAFIATLAIPGLASPGFDINQPAPDLALSFSHMLADDLYLGYSGGLSWDGWYSNPLGYASAMLAIDIDARMNLFAEYGLEANSHAPVLHFADAGLVYTFSDQLVLDAWAGFGLGDPESSAASPHYSSIYRPDVFIGAGAAYRIRL